MPQELHCPDLLAKTGVGVVKIIFDAFFIVQITYKERKKRGVG